MSTWAACGAAGVSGTAYTFGGATAKSYAEVPDAQSLNPGSANLHISFYLNTTSLPASGDYDLVRKGAYPGQEYKIELLQSGAITCVFRARPPIAMPPGVDRHRMTATAERLLDHPW